METKCRHFSGYKPCGKNETCDSLCPSRDIPQTHLLVIHLEALGSVIRATSILPAIKRKFPSSHITWVTQNPAQELLKHNPYIDRILTTERDGLLTLKALEFDFGFIVDKSLKAMGVLASTTCDFVYGFITDSAGAILPATPAAQELWQVGLSDQIKFYENKKTETQLITESLELNYQRDGYVLAMSESEATLSLQRKKEWSVMGTTIVGMNTGCSNTIPAKKLTVEMYRKIIRALLAKFGNQISIVLLGGKEDSLRNQEISTGLPVYNSPSDLGLRDGIVSVAACDIVLTGDSLGMHIAIALEKYVAAWFGPTCAHEIDFYDRGEAILTQATCSPCWKRACQKSTMCYDLVKVEDFVSSVEKGIQWNREFLSSKQPSLGIFSSPSL